MIASYLSGTSPNHEYLDIENAKLIPPLNFSDPHKIITSGSHLLAESLHPIEKRYMQGPFAIYPKTQYLTKGKSCTVSSDDILTQYFISIKREKLEGVACGR